MYRYMNTRVRAIANTLIYIYTYYTYKNTQI